MDTALEEEITEQAFQVPLLKENGQKIDSPQKLFNNLREELFHEMRECLGVVALNTRNRSIWSGIIHIGLLNASLCHPREIFRGAISLAAVALVIVHNHPSGEVQPSLEDRETADMLRASGQLLGIQLVDFVIVGSNSFYSFANEVWNNESVEG